MLRRLNWPLRLELLPLQEDGRLQFCRFGGLEAGQQQGARLDLSSQARPAPGQPQLTVDTPAQPPS